MLQQVSWLFKINQQEQLRLDPRTAAAENPQHNCREMDFVCGWNVKNAQHTNITCAIKENYKALPRVWCLSAFVLMLMNEHACVSGAERAPGRTPTVCMSTAQPWLHCSQKSNQVIGRGGRGRALLPSPNGCRRSDNKQHVMQTREWIQVCKIRESDGVITSSKRYHKFTATAMKCIILEFSPHWKQHILFINIIYNIQNVQQNDE